MKQLLFPVLALPACLIAGVALAAPVTPSSASTGVGASASVSADAAAHPYRMPANDQALLNKYCVSCHNDTDNLPAGKPLYLDETNLDDVTKDADTWELVIRKLGVGAMPPQGKPHPGVAQLQGFRNWLISTLDTAADKENNPGDFVIHRLNRAEYANAVRDLFGVQVDVSGLLPPDSADFGFDNVATALQTTASLLDRYITAAERISTYAVGNTKAETASATFPVHLDVDQVGYIPGLPLGTRGGTLVRYNFPADGEYDLSAALRRPVDSNDAGIEGQDSPNQFIISIDGVRVHSALIGGAADQALSIVNMTAARVQVAERMKVRTFVKAGPHDVIFSFVDRPARSQDTYQLSLRGSQDIHVPAGRPTLSSATIVGPFDAKGVSSNEYRQRLLLCDPKSGSSDLVQSACARKVLAAVARRAYRRPVTDADMNFIMPYYERGRQGANFDAGIRSALPVILTSPDFLFRTEHDPAAAPPGAAHRISDVELASRLSFFLWSSIPDDQLLDLAIAGRLHQPAVLRQQVKRMLADDRATALTTNFPDQWLELRNLATVSPDLLGYPNWDGSLRDDLQKETELFFGSIVRGNRSALDLLNANYTFVNERVARHYGIPGVYGEAFRKVQLTDPNRFGLLGQGSILAITSVATRTSPVFRGKWILTALLDVPPLPPPPNVPALEQNESGTTTVRQRLEVHRKNEPCASCHRNMDPIGFALENFGPTGQWRTADSGQPIDSSGTLVDGTHLNGPVSLRAALTARPDVFVGTMTEKLLTYALGRGLQAYDMPVVRQIVRTAAKDNYRFQDLIMGIVESRPFQMRKKAVPAGPVQQTARVQE